MNASSLGTGLPVLLVGVMICVNPLFTHPTVQFGVRVPDDRTGAPVIRRERRSYYWRTGVAAAVLGLAGTLLGGWTWWALPSALVLEIASGVGCFLLARERITAVKTAEGWYEGLRQTVVADTSWRTDPPRFPWLWTLPAALVALGTAAVGIVRYPDLPDRLPVHFTLGGQADRWADRSIVGALAPVGVQLLTTALIVGLLLLTYRTRPDIDAADVAGSSGRYRVFLTTLARALLVLAALMDVSLLLVALQTWQICSFTGAAALLPVLPALLGGALIIAACVRTGQSGTRLHQPSGAEPTGATGSAPRTVQRDDDRYWRGGLVYVNRDDPALLVGKRFGVGWTLNFGNPRAWYTLAVLAAVALAALAAGLTSR